MQTTKQNRGRNEKRETENKSKTGGEKKREEVKTCVIVFEGKGPGIVV